MFTVLVQCPFCVVLLVSLLSTLVQDSPTPVEVRLFDFELHDDNILEDDIDYESNDEGNEGISEFITGKIPSAN